MEMAYEYQMLALMTLFFLFAWFPTSIAKAQTYGINWLASNRDPVQGKLLTGWGGRADRAYNNLKDYYPAFVVAILLLGINGKFDAGTKWAATFYLIGRVFHLVSYIAGNFPMRFAFYIISMMANIYLLLRVFF